MKAWMSLNFGKFATELLPLIDVRIEFLFNILKTNLNLFFSQIGNRVTALD